ncbi:hypothetical protein MHY1_00373 [Methylovirgula sp. HY1]|nr:hypothetical protein MHY1_00373 [Methylovirgula sp. HY1]
MNDMMMDPQRQNPDGKSFGAAKSMPSLETSGITANVSKDGILRIGCAPDAGRKRMPTSHRALARIRSAKMLGAGIRSFGLTIGLCGFASLSLGFGAAAQNGNAPPMPPARPPSLSNVPAPVPPPANGPPPGVNPMVADFAPDMPQVLPAASRTRMHECGSEWQKMKASGAAADKTWLSFASACLVR